MAQNLFRFIALCLVSGVLYEGVRDGSRPIEPTTASIQPVLDTLKPTLVETPVSEPETLKISPCDCVTHGMESSVGVKELTGNNDGKQVEKYLKNAGLPKGNPWCAAYVKFYFDSCGVKNSITAWSPTAHNKKNIVWKQGWHKEPQRGSDVFTIWYASKKRIGHTGFYYSKVNSVTVETIEGNTNLAGSREGGSVMKRKRAINSLYSITRWE